MRLLLLMAVLLLIAVPAAAAPRTPLVLALGDSLTAGYRLDPGLGFAPQLQASLRRHGIAARVADGGVTGDTSAAARARLGWTLDGLDRPPDLVIVEVGANDMLRGLDPAETERNIDAILAELGRRKLKVLLAGMLAARNLGPGYRARFEAIYPRLANKHGAQLHPFFLDGVAGERTMLLEDGMHPNFRGVKRIVSGILPAVKVALGR